MIGLPQRHYASQATRVLVRPRWLAALPVVLIWACSGGSSAPGDPPDPSSIEPPPDPPPPVATSLTITPDSARLEALGDTTQFTAEVRDRDGNAMADVAVTWSSDAPAVATVSATGLVAAVGAGTATVTVATGELSTSATVTVEIASDPPPPDPPPPDPPPPDPPSVGACIGSSCDREALVALYESTGGENWVNSTNWLSDRPLDEWYGVYLDHDGRISDIALFSNGLSGPIPPEIGNFSTLVYLNLGNNKLSGSLPAELGDLRDLRDLSVFGNDLSGPIPRELGNLDSLESLDLGGNRLSGPIPPELGTLSRLTRLAVWRNELSGPIPRELGNLDSLESLILGGNRLSGPIPPELGALSRLTRLEAWENELSGPIPAELGSLSRLTDLHLTDNKLSGTVPPELTRLPLTLFWWVGNPGLCMPDTADFAAWVSTIGNYAGGSFCNQSDRAVLDALYRVTGGPGWTNADGWPDSALDSRHGIRADADGRVIAIDLSGNGLEGELPLALGDLRFLTALRLGGNPDLAGRLPYTLQRLEGLSEFSYAETGLCVPMEAFLREWLDGIEVHEGTGIDCAPTPDRETLARLYQAMGGMQWFDTTNWLTDTPLREWHGVDTDGQGRVTRLDLTHNGLSGAIPPDIVALERLTELKLVGIDTMQAPIPPELGELANLTVLQLSGIHASGPIPPQFGKLGHLRTLRLSNNEFSGPIPPELGGLTALVVLDLDNNRLAGPIPHELADASALEQIHLANNELSGSLPTSLADLEKLQILDLSGNRLSDYLPTAFGNFERLEYLNLSFNDLFGAIPAELGGLANLTELYLGTNSLSGPVPPELAGLSRLRDLALTGNAELEGPLPAGLANLRELNHLQAIGTKLCAPPDAALLAWLDGLLTRRVPPCGFEPVAAYLTQAIQSRELPIALVAGREALLRVFPTAARANSKRMPSVRATFYLNGTLAHSVDIPSGPGPIPTQLDESSLDRSANASVPAAVVQPGLAMAIEIDPEGTLDEDLGVARRIPETGRLTVEVRAMPRFDITFVPFIWETNPDMSVVELVNAMEADPDGHKTLRFVRTLLPVGEISVTAHAPVRTSSNAGHELIDQTRLVATMEGGSGYYMGLLSGEFEGAAGIGDIGQRVAYSVANADVIAHEFGHNLSLQHAPCGDPLGVEPAYPYANASTGRWGYDFSEQRLVAPDEHHDLMAYCAPPWISDFSFDRMLRYRLHSAGRLRRPQTGTTREPVSSLLIWGGVDAGSAPYLEPAFVAESPPALPQAPGPYRIAGAAADGTVLFDLSFDMPLAADGGGRSGFAFALPVQPGWPESLASITLSGPGGSFALEEDSGRPVTVLRDGPAGQVTAIVREPAAADAMRGASEPGLYSRGIPEPSAWSR